MSADPDERLPYGSSLFAKIPENRIQNEKD